MYFGPSISVGRRGVSYGDSDAQAFIAATGLTGTTEVNAVNNLVANLKSYGLWSKMKAIYPFVSDTVNLLSYSEDFTNAAWSKNNISVTGNTTTAPNGTTTADSIFESAANSLHYTDTTVATTITGQVFTGSVYLKANGRNFATIGIGGESSYVCFDLANGTIGLITGTCTPSIISVGNGWYRCTISCIIAAGASNRGIFVACQNANQGLISYTGDITKGVYIWGAQLQQGALTDYQTISTTSANRFVSQFKYNLKDARDIDAAFRLAFNGTWTYSKQGATPNGVNGYATTYFNTATNLTQFSSSMSVYSRTDATSSGEVMGCDVGGFGRYFRLLLKSSTTPNTRAIQNGVATAATYNGIANSLGLFLSSRTTSTKLILQQNSTILNTNTTTETSLLPSQNVFIGAYSNNGSPTGYTPYQIAFSHLSDGLTDTEATNLYTSVQLFQTALNRQI